jgi:uncharacterized phage protein (TIGR02220 family)
MRTTRLKQKALLIDEGNNVLNGYPEKEIKSKEIKSKEIKSKEIEKEKEKFLCLVTDVVDYFNSVMKTRISIKGVVTNRNIKARSLEGYVLSDFMKVIDVKYEDWISDPKMSKNLNTDTLFGNKFEKYLNQKKSMTAVDSVFGESTIKDINSLEYKPF